MENNQDFMKDQEMIAMLEQLRHDIVADIEKRKMTYIGQDGHDYYDKESLDAANKDYIERMYKFIGRDGHEYGTTEQLDAANQRYNETMLSKIKEDNGIYYNDSDNLETSHKIR